MASEPFIYYSAKPDTSDRLFPNWGGSGADTQGLGVEASLGANATWKLRWLPFAELPEGTLKLQIDAMANAETGNAILNPQWASVAADGSEDPDAFTLNDEGNTTASWTTDEDNKLKRIKITLDADTLVAGEWLVMDLNLLTSGWTLAALATFYPALVWDD